MINKYLNYVSQKKSQIIIFILFNLCGLAFILLPYGIVWNMLDLNLSYTSADVFKSFYQMGENGRYINLYSTLILDTIYPILYTSLILGAYVKLFKNNNLILFIPTTAFLLDIIENINIASNEFNKFLSHKSKLINKNYYLIQMDYYFWRNMLNNLWYN